MAYLILKVLHVLSFCLLVAGVVAVVLVAKVRSRYGPAFQYDVDRFAERGIRSGLIVGIGSATASLVTGVLLVIVQFVGIGAVLWNVVLLIKIVLWIVLTALLHYLLLAVHRRIEGLLDRCGPHEVISDAFLADFLFARRKQRVLTAATVFVVLVLLVLGVQVHAAYPIVVTAASLAVAAGVSVWAGAE